MRCHSGDGSPAGYFDALDRESFIDVYVFEDDVENSDLMQQIVADAMPPRNGVARVSGAEADILKQWIEAGAPDFPQRTEREFLTLERTLSEVLSYLREQRKEDRPHLRFFSLVNLHNNPSILDEDLRIHRAAVSKAINSLSHKSRIAVPEPIDALHTLFVIDLRDYGWDEFDWEAIGGLYPYGLSYQNHENERLRRLSEDLDAETDCSLPVLRGDWFVANATRPPLYHHLLDIPQSAKTLEQRLGVDIARDFRRPAPDVLARAGFARSGVSGQNRLLERSDSEHGMYWKSYDFLPGAGRSKLTRFPLGPQNLYPKGEHPFEGQAFIHDGGEIIWRLPNKLQGYMLVDGEDNRIDAGPIDVVSDAIRTSGTPAIVNGLSCMACHTEGMLDFTDQIRAGSAVFGGAEQHVRRLYPTKEEFDEIVSEDREIFLEALEDATGEFLQVGEEKNTPIEDFPEVVGDAARWHTLVYIDLKTAASEMHLDDPQEFIRRVGLRRLKELGLEPLTDGGVISRGEWEAFDGVSLYQELARALGYTPFRPVGPFSPTRR